MLPNPTARGYPCTQDSEHPRASLKPGPKAWCQTTHCECLAQMAVFPQGRKELLLQDPALRVCEALQAVVERGLSDEAKEHAKSALLALSDTELVMVDEGQKHVMLSCAFPAQCDAVLCCAASACHQWY